MLYTQVGMTPTNDIDVYNLKPGYGYKFRVTARNGFGWGQPVVTADYVQVSEPKCLPEFRQPLPGETKVLLCRSATLQCHVSVAVFLYHFKAENPIYVFYIVLKSSFFLYSDKESIASVFKKSS